MNININDFDIESIQASDFESDTIRDSDKNLHDTFSVESKEKNRIKQAPIVHMNSICSMSETASSSVQNSSSNMRLLDSGGNSNFQNNDSDSITLQASRVFKTYLTNKQTTSNQNNIFSKKVI